tara:strand:+ start:2331 stop:2741 length:411 start_codon:yes stop_codon:yes gene_type:complete
MRIKLKNVISSISALNALSIKKMPISLSFRLSKVNVALEPNVASYQKMLNKIMEENRIFRNKETGEFELIENNNEIALNAHDVWRFNKEHEELLNQDIEVELPEIKLSEFTFKDSEGNETQFEPFIFTSLYWLIKE